MTTTDVLLAADLSQLATYAGRLEKRMRFSPAAYIVFATTFSSAAALFPVTSSELAPALRGPLLLLVGLLGSVQVVMFARDRKHYLRVVGAFNDIRRTLSGDLELPESYRTLWTGSPSVGWPPDSASTLTLLVLLVFATGASGIGTWLCLGEVWMGVTVSIVILCLTLGLAMRILK